jgi:hypothetical protein
MGTITTLYNFAFNMNGRQYFADVDVQENGYAETLTVTGIWFEKCDEFNLSYFIDYLNSEDYQDYLWAVYRNQNN